MEDGSSAFHSDEDCWRSIADDARAALPGESELCVAHMRGLRKGTAIGLDNTEAPRSHARADLNHLDQTCPYSTPALVVKLS